MSSLEYNTENQKFVARFQWRDLMGSTASRDKEQLDRIESLLRQLVAEDVSSVGRFVVARSHGGVWTAENVEVQR